MVATSVGDAVEMEFAAGFSGGVDVEELTRLGTFFNVVSEQHVKWGTYHYLGRIITCI